MKIKVLAFSSSLIFELEKEINFLKTLKHPNIVLYLGERKTSDYFYIFMEFMPGGSIASMIKQWGPLKELIIKKFVKQILSGLDYLHKQGVLHGDLKV